MRRHGIYASNTSLSCFAMRALTTCLAGSTLAQVAGFRPIRRSRCCTTSFAIPGSTNSSHRNRLLRGQLLQVLFQSAPRRAVAFMSSGSRFGSPTAKAGSVQTLVDFEAPRGRE